MPCRRLRCASSLTSELDDGDSVEQRRRRLAARSAARCCGPSDAGAVRQRSAGESGGGNSLANEEVVHRDSAEQDGEIGEREAERRSAGRHVVGQADALRILLVTPNQDSAQQETEPQRDGRQTVDGPGISEQPRQQPRTAAARRCRAVSAAAYAAPRRPPAASARRRGRSPCRHRATSAQKCGGVHRNTIANSSAGIDADVSGHRRPADDRRERAGGAADDDVLRRAALQPDRVDEDVEGDRQRQPCGRDESWSPAPSPRPRHREHDAETQRRARFDLAHRDRPPAGPPHHRIDVAIVPHVDRARRARPPPQCTARR